MHKASRSPEALIRQLHQLYQRVTELEHVDTLYNEACRQNQQMEVILNSIPAMIFYKDKHNRIIQVNQAFADFVGMSREDIQGKTCFELWPEQAESYWRNDKEVMRSNLPKRNIVEQLPTRYGMRWVASDKIPYTDEKGHVIGIIGFSVDITEHKRAEEKLKQSEELYRLISENTSDCIAVTTFNLQAIFTYVSPSYERILGYLPKELLGTSSLDFIHPDDKKRLFPVLRSYVYKRMRNIIFKDAGPIDYHFEWRVFDKEGDIHHFESTANVVGDKIIYISRDITERKKVETTYHESEKKYKDLIEGLHVVIYRMSLPDGAYEYITPTARHVFGYSAKEFLQKPFFIKRILHPEFAGYFEQQWALLLEGKVPPVYEYKILDMQGHSRWIIQSNRGVFDDEGNIIAIEGLCSDITESRKHEDLLKERKEQLNAIVHSITDCMCMIDRDFHIIWANPVSLEMFGDDMVGKKCHEVFCGRETPCEPCVVEKVLEQDAEHKTDKQIVPASGSTTYFHVTANVALRDHDGRPLAVLTVLRDVTDSKVLEKEFKYYLMDMEQLKQDMILRENKMIELKKEINQLSQQMNRPEPYDI